jgi:hypothetical protein
MQQLQHKQFTVWNEQSSLPIRYCYVPATTGFAPDSYRDGNMSNDDKRRPRNER